jgi:hypothetical protein
MYIDSLGKNKNKNKNKNHNIYGKTFKLSVFAG